MLNLKQIPITCLLIASLIAAVTTGCRHTGEVRQILSFDSDWLFDIILIFPPQGKIHEVHHGIPYVWH
jgi:hypothetical protein